VLLLEQLEFNVTDAGAARVNPLLQRKLSPLLFVGKQKRIGLSFNQELTGR
jgi:hypothetical protein